MTRAHRLRLWRRRRPVPVILMYHRVALPECDPWALSITPTIFDDHLDALCAERTPMSLEDLVTGLERGNVPASAVAITFDDGYADNLDAAAPLLQSRSVPATVFLTTDPIITGTRFWWDELAAMVLQRASAAEAEFDLDGERITIRLPEETVASSTWRAWEEPRTERQRVYFSLWSRLHSLTPAARRQGIDALRQALATTTAAEAGLARVLTPREAASLAKVDGIDIGAHTRSHPLLTELPDSHRNEEIRGSRCDCRALTGRRVAGFAYPHGNRNPSVEQMVSRSGFSWACSTREGAIDPRRYRLHDLPRIQAGNWHAAYLAQVLATAEPVR